MTTKKFIYIYFDVNALKYTNQFYFCKMGLVCTNINMSIQRLKLQDFKKIIVKIVICADRSFQRGERN